MGHVTFEAVEKTYPNGFSAVKDLNLEINDGELSLIHI